MIFMKMPWKRKAKGKLNKGWRKPPLLLEKIMKAWQGLFVTVLLFLLLGLVGRMDYQDELLAEQHYTDMVCAGHYPDYKDLEPICN